MRQASIRQTSTTNLRLRWYREYQRARNANYREYSATLHAMEFVPQRMYRRQYNLHCGIHVSPFGSDLASVVRWGKPCSFRQATLRNVFVMIWQARHRRELFPKMGVQ